MQIRQDKFWLGTFATLPVLFTAVAAHAGPQPLSPLGPGFNQSTYSGSLRSTVFASGLDYPTSMQSYGGGVLVGTTTGGTFYSGTTSGHLLLLTDSNHDGVADQTSELTPSGGLPGAITSVRQAGSLLFVTSLAGSSGSTISVLKQDSSANAPFTSIGTISLGFSANNWEHTSYALATRPTPGASGNYDLFFNLGSRTNTSDAGNFQTYFATANTSGGASGLNNVHLNPESIYKTTVTTSGSTASFSAPVQVAGGVRNAAGIAVQSGTGDLYFEDNGIDGVNDKYGNSAYSQDTLHKIQGTNIGVSFPSTNFATDYFEDTRTTTTTDAYGNQRAVATKHGTPDAIANFAPFGPFDPSDRSSPNESEGPNEIAFAPANFPAGLNNGVFLGFHGEFNKSGAPDPTTGAGNEENPVVYYDFTTGTYFHFIGTQEPDVGHLDGVLSTADSLYLSDFSDGDLVGSQTNLGSIYQISVVPEPATIATLAMSATVTFAAGQRRSRR